MRYSYQQTTTKYTFTGQYSNVSDFGLMFYNARWYDSSLGRFTSADTVVPGGVQGYDRYAYANNNPVVYNDPSGHVSCTSGNWDDGPQCRYRDSMLKGGYRSITVGARTGGGRPDLGTTAEESYADNSSGPQQTTIDPVTGKTYESPAEDRSVAGGIGNALAAAEDLAKSMDKTLSPVNLYGRLQYYESADGSVSLKSVFVINASDDYVRLKRMQVTGGGQSYDVNPQLITSPNADVYGLGAGTSKSIALTLSGNPANPANSFGNGSGSVGLNLIWRTKTEQKWSWMTFSIR